VAREANIGRGWHIDRYNHGYKSLLEYYDADTVSWLLSIADKYRQARKSRLTERWHEFILFREGIVNVDNLKKSTVRSWKEGHHPLGCLNIPQVTPKFMWVLAGIIGDGDAVVYYHKQKNLDMFVVRLKTKDQDFCERAKEAFNEAGIAATSYPIDGGNMCRCVAYSLLIFSIIKAVREATKEAIIRLLKPLLVTPTMKKSFIKGCADSEGYVYVKRKDGKIVGYDIYVFTNKNMELIKFVSELLEDLQYPHSITKKTDDCYGIRLRTRNPQVVLRFNEEMGFSIRRKSKDLQKVVNFVKKAVRDLP